jgi:hypothetical protein
MADSSGLRAGLKGNADEALRLFAMEAEWDGLNLAETEFVLEETLKCYGSTFDGAMILELFKFYRRYLGMADVGRRQQLLTRMTEFLSNGQQHRSIALLCFISADTDGQITSGAALDLAMVMPADKGDPLTGPKFAAFHGCGGVRAKLGKPGSDDEGDVAAGLLLLGDMRLLPLLEEIWERLTPEGRRRMVQRRSNLVSALMVEFLLRRLEADKDEEYFGELGAALHNLPAIAANQPINAVLDLRRNFGLPPGKEPMELIGHEDIPTAFARFRPRLQALIDRESGPIKVLNATISVWAEAAGWSPPAGTENVEVTEVELDPEEEEELDYEVDEGDEDAEDDDIEVTTRVLAQDLHDEFDLFVNEDELPPEICYYENPYVVRDLTAKDVKSALSPQKFLPLLVTGIFNPFGPTVCVYGVQRTRHDDCMLLRFQLNPFSCTMGPVALMDLEKTFFATGDFDEKESARKKILVAHGRTTPSLDVTHDILTRIALGKSRLQASFSLCVSSARISKQKSLERIAIVYQAAPKARQELEDLRDKKKRNDPWARADMAEAMRRIDTPQPAPAPLTKAEASELAGIVLNPDQQRIEMANLLAAWEGATDFSPLSPVMTKNQFLEAIVMLTTDMPNLVNHSGPFHADDLTRDVPGGSPQKSAATPPEATAAKQPAAEVKKAEETAGTPKYKGVLWFIYAFAMVEVLLCLVALLWALFCAEWWLLLVLLLFAALNFLRIGGMSARDAWTRWFAIGLYGLMLWYVGYRIHQHNLSGLPSGAAFLLLDVLVFWFGPMCFLNLICFDYAKQMRDAPDEPA